jgi:hypothetical protein
MTSTVSAVQPNFNRTSLAPTLMGATECEGWADGILLGPMPVLTSSVSAPTMGRRSKQFNHPVPISDSLTLYNQSVAILAFWTPRVLAFATC